MAIFQLPRAIARCLNVESGGLVTMFTASFEGRLEGRRLYRRRFIRKCFVPSRRSLFVEAQDSCASACPGHHTTPQLALILQRPPSRVAFSLNAGRFASRETTRSPPISAGSEVS